ncbi:hypothetical protein vseg_011888 [Gypsophila vaccaria]
MDFPRSVFPKPDWAWLPENVLYMILTELFMLSDLISFGAVCRSWRSVRQHRLQEMNIHPNMSIRKRLPMLLIPADSGERRNLYSLPDEEVYHVGLPVPYNNRCIGSCHGWLIFLDSVSFVVTLFNPFYFGNSKGTIKLPLFQTARDFFQSDSNYEFFPEYFVSKAVLSADPNSCPNYSVALIYGEFRSLAYYKSGDETWTCIPGNPLIYDIIYHTGRFIAVCLWGELYTFNPEANRPQLESFSTPLYGPIRSNARRYIMMSYDGNTLLQVVRSIDFCPIGHNNVIHHTKGFWVYKLGRVSEMFDWLLLSSIGDSALFVGDSHSYCVKASDFPGIIPNAIYYTDDYPGFGSVYHNPYKFKGPFDTGVFLVGDEALHSHYDPDDIHKYLIPPIWILPTI